MCWSTQMLMAYSAHLCSWRCPEQSRLGRCSGGRMSWLTACWGAAPGACVPPSRTPRPAALPAAIEASRAVPGGPNVT